MEFKEALDKIALALYETLWAKYHKHGENMATYMTYHTPQGVFPIKDIPDEFVEHVVNRICQDIKEMGKRIDDERFVANLATQALKRNAR